MKQDTEDRKLVASVVLLERFVRDIYPSKHSSAIQPLQWSILRYLARMPDQHREVRWIAKFLGITRAPVTRAIATLEARNLVVQTENSTDARTKKISLTDEGAAVLKQDPIVDAAKRIGVLPENERALFIKSIRTLALDLEEEEHDEQS